MMDFLLNLLGLLVGVVLGGYILLFGRRALWATSSIITLAATANLLEALSLLSPGRGLRCTASRCP